MSEDWQGAQNGSINNELKDEIVKVALDHHIMTQYTSFVAVEEKTITKGGVAKTVTVPVEMPDGVSRDMTLGESDTLQGATNGAIGAGGGGAGAGGFARAKRRSSHGLVPPPPAAFPTSQSAYGNPYASTTSRVNGKFMASMPKPVASPAPLAQAGGRGGSGWTAGPSADRGQAFDKRESSKLKASLPMEANKNQDEEKAEPAKEAKDDRQEKSGAKLSSVLKQLVGNTKNANALHVRVQDGKVSIEIELTEASEANIKALKKLGFELILQEKTKVTGRISLEKLEALTKFKFVKQVTESK